MISAQATHDRVVHAVAADLRPVRPLLSPARRAAALIPVALVVAAVAFKSYGRADLRQLGPAITWGLSAVQWALGLLILALAFREATPGSALSRRVLWLVGIATSVLIVVITLITFAAHPTFTPRSTTLMLDYLCVVGSVLSGLPLLAIAAFFAVRAFPTTPVRAGGLCGLATGVVVDSGWRLTCWITTPAHVLTAHVLAVAGLMACGAIVVGGWDKLRLLRTRT